MGKLLENLDARVREKAISAYGGDLGSDNNPDGWKDISMDMEIAFGARRGVAINDEGVYYRRDEGEQEHGLLWGIREMFMDVFLSIIDTIKGPKCADLKLVVEPHIISPTKVVVIWRNKFILFSHDYHICYFDFDDAHALEVFMQNIKTFITKRFKEINNE